MGCLAKCPIPTQAARLGGAGPWRFGWHIPPQTPGSDCGARSVELCTGVPMTHAEGQRRREGPFPQAGEHPRSTLTHSLTHLLEIRQEVGDGQELCLQCASFRSEGASHNRRWYCEACWALWQSMAPLSSDDEEVGLVMELSLVEQSFYPPRGGPEASLCATELAPSTCRRWGDRKSVV